MDVALKVSCLGLCAALLAALIRKSNPETALCLALAGGAVILYFAFSLVSQIADAAREARELSGLTSGVFAPVLKCVVVGIVCSIASDACKDSGSAQLASAVDVAGAVAALFCALPLFSSFLNTVEGLL